MVGFLDTWCVDHHAPFSGDLALYLARAWMASSLVSPGSAPHGGNEAMKKLLNRGGVKDRWKSRTPSTEVDHSRFRGPYFATQPYAFKK